MNQIRTRQLKSYCRASFGMVALVASGLLAGPARSYAQTPVRDVENPTRQPFQTQIADVRLVPDRSETLKLTDVPLGKRLVIEHVSLAGTAGNGAVADTRVEAKLKTQVNGTIVDHPLAFFRSRLPDFAVVHPMRVYADPGTTVSLVFGTLATGGGGVLITGCAISGYFVDIQ